MPQPSKPPTNLRNMRFFYGWYVSKFLPINVHNSCINFPCVFFFLHRWNQKYKQQEPIQTQVLDLFWVAWISWPFAINLAIYFLVFPIVNLVTVVKSFNCLRYFFCFCKKRLFTYPQNTVSAFFWTIHKKGCMFFSRA